jgi:hypothetical protein
VAVEELDAWFSSFVAYKGKAGVTDRPKWLVMHSGSNLTLLRLGTANPP